jgi:hypothetical protein
MPGEHVEGTAFAEVGERHLRHDRPAQQFEPREKLFTEGRMPSVKNTFELAATPANDEHDLCVERHEELPQCPHGQSFDPTALEARDHVVSDTYTFGHVRLAQPEAVA